MGVEWTNWRITYSLTHIANILHVIIGSNDEFINEPSSKNQGAQKMVDDLYNNELPKPKSTYPPLLVRVNDELTNEGIEGIKNTALKNVQRFDKIMDNIPSTNTSTPSA